MRYALIEARKQKVWRQSDFAKQIGVDASCITKYERGRCDIPGKVLERMADVLNIPMHVLYHDTPDPHDKRPGVPSTERGSHPMQQRIRPKKGSAAP